MKCGVSRTPSFCKRRGSVREREPAAACSPLQSILAPIRACKAHFFDPQPVLSPADLTLSQLSQHVKPPHALRWTKLGSRLIQESPCPSVLITRTMTLDEHQKN